MTESTDMNETPETPEVLDEFHWHEAMDRAAMLASIVEKYLSEHPAVQQSGIAKDYIEAAARMLWEAYQELGCVRFRAGEKAAEANDPQAQQAHNNKQD